LKEQYIHAKLVLVDYYNRIDDIENAKLFLSEAEELLQNLRDKNNLPSLNELEIRFIK
jgi:hypothetical protein